MNMLGNCVKHYVMVKYYDCGVYCDMRKKFLLSALYISCILFSGCNTSNPMNNSDTTCDSSTEVLFSDNTAQISEPENATTALEISEATTEQSLTETTVSVSEEPSLRKLLQTAFLPLGHTMYVWGGGWNEEDTAAGIEAVTIGTSPRWAEFAAMQDSSYNFKDTYYLIHDGLDCSGYIGWLIYNIFPEKEEGYVMKASEMAKTFSSYGWGSYTPAAYVVDWRAGDIMSMPGHVWMALCECDDGSVLLIHSSPPGVRICGTKLPPGSEGTSQAEQFATQIMSTYYPDWYSRYPDCSVDYNYLTDSNQFRWNKETFSDVDEIWNMTSSELLDFILNN